MKIGIQYYRDPNPPEEYWEKDLADIAAAGFSVIGCWIPWRYVNPAEGCWELDKYRRLLNLAHQRKLSVRIQLVPESAPDWAVRAHPDALQVNDAGQSVYLHPHPMLQLGGWPGLSLFHPGARALVDDYYRQVIARLKDHPSIGVWSIWNEIQAEPTYDPHAQAAHRAWLARRYGTIEAYNRERFTACRDFEDIVMPNPGIEKSMVLSRAADLAEFRRDWCVSEARHRAQLVRGCDASRPIAAHTNSASPFTHSKDDWGIAASVDLYGDSHYHAHPFWDVMSFVKCRSAAGPGNWWMTEHCSGRMVYYYGHQTLSGERLVSNALLALGYGADAANFWQYRPERCEQEAPNFNLLHQDGTPSERLSALSRLAGAVHNLDARQIEFDPVSVGLLIEPLDAVFRAASDTWRKQDWQEFNETERWMWTLLNLGHTFDFLQARRLPEKGIPKSMKLILAPSLVVLRPGVAEVLADWVRNGGHLMAGPFTGVYDPGGRVFAHTPGGLLADLFGLTVTDRVSGNRFELTDAGGREAPLQGRHLFEQVRLKAGAETLRAWNGQSGLIANRYGDGSARYAATFLGADCDTFGQDDYADRSPLSQWMDAHLRDMNVRPPAETDGTLWLAAARNGADRLLFLFNPLNRPATIRVAFPRDADRWRDFVSGQTVAANGTGARLDFAPRQTRLFASGADGERA